MVKQPNVIWIMADQLRAQALACNGDTNANTPNIDKMCHTGIHFQNAVGGYPLCCPFRGSMITGVYPHKCVPGHEYQLPPNQRTIAPIMRENGYHTAYVGKWHLDGFHESQGRAAFHVVPKERRGGFDYWLGYENNNAQYDCYVHGGDETSEIPPTLLDGYETDCLTDLFLQHLQTLPNNQPFFGILSVQPPHDPYDAPERNQHYPKDTLKLRKNVPDIPAVVERTRQDLSGMYAMIENLDENIGRIVQYLNDTGAYENTHILFFSDHGDMHGSHGMMRKTNPFEESIRVPFLISGGKGQTGNRAEIVNHVDIAPTTLGLCGIPVPEDMEGMDYSYIRMGTPPSKGTPTSAYIQSVIPTHHGESTELPWRGVVTEDGWKYVCTPYTPWLLFHLREDPYEQQNGALNSSWRRKRQELNALLQEWITKTGDTFPLPTYDEDGFVIVERWYMK